MVFIEVIVFLLALAVLVKGADVFVESSIKVARLLKVNTFIIGLTLVAIGTSIPELASALFASTSSNTGLIMGNITGSNINNLSLILGIGALLAFIHIKRNQLKRNMVLVIAVSLLLLIFSLNGVISRSEGILFLFLFIVYLLYLFKHHEHKHEREYIQEVYLVQRVRNFISGSESFLDKIFYYSTYTRLFRKITLYELQLFGTLIVSGAAIYFGAKFVVPSAVSLAEFVHVPQNVIGLTILALGTTLPELATTIASARKKADDILLGNLMGSNITNILLIIGTSAVITPLRFDFSSLIYPLAFMLFVVLIASFFVFTETPLRKKYGLFLLGCYLVFMFFFLLFVV